MIQQPKSEDAERALLGSLIIEPKLLDEVVIEPEMFYYQKNSDIYKAMKEIGKDELDVVSLSSYCSEKHNDIDMKYLMLLINDTPSFMNAQKYADLIEATYARRKAIRIAEELANSAFTEDKKLDEAITKTITQLVNIAKSDEGAKHIEDYIRELAEEVDKRIDNPKKIFGLQTGLQDFDKITRGLQKQEQFILAGQPNTGKSLLAFQLACGMAEHGHAGVIYELEMSGVAIVRRRISSLSKNPTENLRSGYDVNYESYIKAIEKTASLPVYISENTDMTTLKLRADLARLKNKVNLEWFMVDYMTLLADNYGKDTIEKSAYLSQQIHNIAKELDLAALVIHSLNKTGYGSNPNMASLSGSSNISYDADQIAILVSEDTPNVVSLNWEKMRESEAGRQIKLYKIPGFPLFESYAERTTENKAYWND
jgi:replicative DNA helicase